MGSNPMEVARCGATTRGGGACGKTAGWGTGHPGDGRCKFHGGAAPQVEAAAERRRRTGELEQAVVTYGLPIETDPGDALLDLVALAAGHVAWLAQEIRLLAPEALTWGVARRSHEAGYNSDGRVDVSTKVEAAGINVLLEIYHRERDLLRRTASDAARLGIAKKKLELAERTGERAGEFLRLALAPLGLAPEQIRQVVQAGTPHLHLLAGGSSAG